MVLPVPIVDEELPHGFTIRRINGLAVAVAWTRVRASRAISDPERLRDYAHVARVAIIENLYLIGQQPTHEDLLREGQRAIRAYSESENRFHGITRDKHTHEPRINNGYLRFWWTSSQTTRSPEEPIIERLAMRQILDTLRPSDRQVLEALAEHDDYGLAAEALGKSRRTFTTQVATARRAFLRLWHEGEIPSRSWGHDRRKIPGQESRASATYVINRRRRDKERVNGDTATTANPNETHS